MLDGNSQAATSTPTVSWGNEDPRSDISKGSDPFPHLISFLLCYLLLPYLLSITIVFHGILLLQSYSQPTARSSRITK